MKKNLFERLLSNNDQDLYDWLIKKENFTDQDKDLQMIIEKIRDVTS